jgi:D-beta-D-heptose 7-phosphate kinase/D-beta-D-heptose 1-phosphate adenosyltransferase
MKVFTNGCFDILHIGHIDYLRASKRAGDYLVVGLNSDASIKRLKGGTRPINSQLDRRAMLLELRCVDEVIIFDEDTPLELIKQVNPDIVTKGGDYKPEDVVSNGKPVIILPLIAGYSTTRLCDLMGL